MHLNMVEQFNKTNELCCIKCEMNVKVYKNIVIYLGPYA